MVANLSGTPHKVRRAIVQRYYSGPAAKNYQIVQQDETRELLRVMADSPDDFYNHLKRSVARNIPTFTS
jgi:hypothetical protein